MDVDSWLSQDKVEVTSILQRECENGNFDNLNRLLDIILYPESDLDSPETIEWCQTLIAAGQSIEQFKINGKFLSKVKIFFRIFPEYDWTSVNFM